MSTEAKLHLSSVSRICLRLICVIGSDSFLALYKSANGGSLFHAWPLIEVV